MVWTVISAIAVAAASLYLSSVLQGADEFAAGACGRIEAYLQSEIIGQDFAIEQMSNAICDHLALERPLKPLVLSAHGPPGVGKTFMHFLLAKALYSKTPEQELDCPGPSCPSYKVLYGLDYTVSEQEQQHDLLRASILQHLRYNPETLLVIEEYDNEIDCPTRGLLKQLIDSPQSTNTSYGRSIIILESNTGFLELHSLLRERGSRAKISAEEVQKLLKDLLFSLWNDPVCGPAVGLVKLLSLIDFYLPFFPLERWHVDRLFRMKLENRQREEMDVDFNGNFPVEGAMEVRSITTRYVTQAVNQWRVTDAFRDAQKMTTQRKKAGHAPEIYLRLSNSGNRLEIVS